jgi:hypothetical protein
VFFSFQRHKDSLWLRLRARIPAALVPTGMMGADARVEGVGERSGRQSGVRGGGKQEAKVAVVSAAIFTENGSSVLAKSSGKNGDVFVGRGVDDWFDGQDRETFDEGGKGRG